MNCEKSKAPDIYFDPRYGKISEIIEDGEVIVFAYRTNDGEITHQFIKRKIERLLDGKTFYDIITPYGYGGPVVNSVTGSKEKLIHDFSEAFAGYCRKQSIVSEFIRFHPLVQNALDFESIYDVQYMRKTVATDLKSFDDPFVAEFSKSCRRSVKKAIESGVSYEIIESPDNLDSFIEIYYETMRRNHAEAFYYFGKEYFDACIRYFKDNIVLVNALYADQIIGSELYFVWNNTYIHSHLSGTRDEFLKISPDYVIMYAITLWGKEKGYNYIHTGGGTTNAEDDSLYLFKKKFAKHTDFDFYIGKKIWLAEEYDQLCELIGRNTDGFFPAYRTR